MQEAANQPFLCFNVKIAVGDAFNVSLTCRLAVWNASGLTILLGEMS